VRIVKFNWLQFCRLLRSLPEVVACEDDELRTMLIQPTPPFKKVDEIGRPMPGSSLINEHPDLSNYRRVTNIRHQGCIENGDTVGARYFGRLIEFLNDRANDPNLLIVCLSTDQECYEVLYSPDAPAALFSRVRYLEGSRQEGGSILDPPGDPPPPRLKSEDLEIVRLVRRWSSVPPPYAEILQLWHFWPQLSNQSLGACLEAVRRSPTYTLGIMDRWHARWWQLRAQEHGLVLMIEETNE
jgi:hypothetical protein